jgi:glucose-1-phosphate cytidylyltransferase
MKTVILCGGLGSRLSEETKIKPKPMVKIGKKPILCHITEIYQKFGFDEFILALGYKGYYIKNFYSKKKNLQKINLVDTGKNTMTGGRLLKLKKFFKKGDTFMLTYGDGLSSHNIKKLLNFHKKQKKIATMTAVRPPARFGEIKLKNNKVHKFEEKPQVSNNWINGGFFVFDYKIFDFIKNDQTMLEREPLEKLTKIGQLAAYKHYGFWRCMDTMRDKILLDKMCKENKIPWKK